MSDAPLCDFAGSLSVDLDRQDGWDSSLQLLWELEQKEPLQSDLPSSCANTTLDDSPAGYRAKAPNLNGTGTDRRLQNRRMAQKRFRLREKVCIPQVLL